MPIWKKNLVVCWFGMFATGIGMIQIAPVLPLYISHLGVGQEAAVAQLSGIAFGSTFIMSAIFSPIWGSVADTFGRKPMLLRASLGMAIVIGCMGFAPNVTVLIGLRLLQGVITGYSTACTTLIATQTDQEHAGWALGTLSTANIAGALLGPLIGGFLSEHFGLQNVFFMTGALMMVSFFTTFFFVKESFQRTDKKVRHAKEIWHQIPEKSLTVTLFVTAFILTIALYSVEPIVTVFMGHLTNSSHLALLSGLAFSASGLANIIAAPRLGKLSDRVGAHKVMVIALVTAGLLFIPQAFVTAPWQLIMLRFLFGLTAGGLMPSVNIMIRKITPTALTGRVFGFSMSAMYLGVFGGSVFGGQIAAWLSIRAVFFCTAALLLMNGLWVYCRVYRQIACAAQSSTTHRLRSDENE
ncbi:MFS transporter [Sporolactobacillus inulinus CASD]|uniref:MFS transporter n=1 Tax=Sporolactobacillus inulinus CASD TaxID=1069536 RepID=A0A0U1QLI2_9BACL|nr:multidrug efflux MFS transporter [Sporolactobacillus inulinus]KLI01621.1 MFS transporter [Sporolactobacillus inulinus CASD]